MPTEMTTQSAPGRTRPRLVEVQDVACPAVPESVSDAGVPEEMLADLALKIVHVAPHFTNDWLAGQIRLPRSIVADLLEQLMLDRLVEVVGQDGPLSYRWTISDKGRDRAVRLLEICGYAGPAPVSIEAYSALTDWQCDHLPQVSPKQVVDATESLILDRHAIEVAGLAAMSRRSLFLYGPPGNGKTTIGHLLHRAMLGEIWIPHAIAVGHEIVRVYDPQVHHARPVTEDDEQGRRIDQRWVRVARPFVVAAGELQLEDLDLAYSPAMGYYEAPLPMKANGGIFLLDDFGYQKANPFQLLNRWVFPLEHGIDFLTVRTGQKLYVPFRQMLIVSTNLDPEAVMEPAILRRIGYRLYLGNPSPERYREIFDQYAGSMGVEVTDSMVEHVLDRHRGEGRPLRGCVPRDLLLRVRDICKYRGHPFEVSAELLDMAWVAYFGVAPSDPEGAGWV